MAATAFASNTVMVIWSVLGAPHGPLLMDHCSMTVPGPRPVTPVLGDPGVVIVAVPLTTDQLPVVGASGVFAASVAMPGTLHTLWSGPAFAVARPSNRVIVT